MKISFFRAVLIGVLIGALTFIAFRLVLVLLIVGAILKLAGKGRRNGNWREHKLAYVEEIRTMKEDEYQTFRSHFERGHRHHC